MSTIIIEGVAPFDGSYEFDFSKARTARELYFFKQVAKVGWDEIGPTIVEGSTPLVVAGLATIALVRAGKIPKEQAVNIGDSFLDLEDGSIRLVLADDAEADKDPPAKAPPAD